MMVVLFLGGTQLMALGILGEYLARVFVEVKQRPLYLLSETWGQRADLHRPEDHPPPPSPAP
jgi:hypothetical protein